MDSLKGRCQMVFIICGKQALCKLLFTVITSINFPCPLLLLAVLSSFEDLLLIQSSTSCSGFQVTSSITTYLDHCQSPPTCQSQALSRIKSSLERITAKVHSLGHSLLNSPQWYGYLSLKIQSTSHS